MDVLIHIGQPKTGSSAIQSFLNCNRETLVSRYKLLYPNFSGLDFGKGLYHNHFPLFSELQNKNIYDQCLIDFKHCEKFCKRHGIEKLVISCEGFGWRWWPSLLKKIVEALDSDFKIILYLRRQDLWFESAWKEWGHKLKDFTSIHDYISRTNADWYWNLNDWIEHFSVHDFIVRPFEKSTIGDDVVIDFLKICGIFDKSGLVEPKFTNFNINKGFKPEIIEILDLCSHLVEKSYQNRILDFLFSSLPKTYIKSDPFSPYGLLSPLERLSIIRNYEESNIKLAQLFYKDNKQSFFLEPLPDPDEPWVSERGLTIEKIIPVFMEILIHQHQQIESLKKNHLLKTL